MAKQAHNKQRLTMAQALVRYIAAQYVERDGVEQPFFAGVLGHFRSRQRRRDRAGASAVRRQASATIRRATSRRRFTPPSPTPSMKNRLQTFACTSSIGPGATNMITGAALATVNRIPVLLLPGDIFARAHSSARLAAVGKRTHAGYWRQRLLQARLALLGSHQPPGADHHGAARSACAC